MTKATLNPPMRGDFPAETFEDELLFEDESLPLMGESEGASMGDFCI